MAEPGPAPGGSGDGGPAPGPAPGGGPAAASPRQPRRGPAPFASFDHDVSDEVRPDSSPEKPTIQLPEILEDSAAGDESRDDVTLGLDGRARSASTPGTSGTSGALQATPRIDISRASSSSHHDSRDSSPEMALFGADPPARLEAAYREDAQDLRSSTEELSFLEQPTPASAPPAAAPAAQPPRRHSRKDSQGSEAALLGVGRSSRLSSVGSQCSAVSALSALSGCSRLSVASATSRSPSPHKMLLETSFCGPKPIDTDVELCAAAVERCLLEMSLPALVPAPDQTPVKSTAPVSFEVRAEVTVEPPPNPRPAPTPAATVASVTPAPGLDKEKSNKESRNRRARSRERRAESRDKPEVYRAGNRSKDIIRIKLRPDDSEERDDEEEEEEPPPKPASLELRATRDTRSRTPSPAPGAHSRKSSFCSLFKSRETIASPESPAAGRSRKRSPERSRSKSRERTSARGSVLSLFRGARRSRPASPAEPAVAPAPAAPAPMHVPPAPGGERLPYYEPAAIIHIPLRTPPAGASAPTVVAASATQPPRIRTVLPDGSIIIPLHSPTEKTPRADQGVKLQVETVRVESSPAVPTVAGPTDMSSDSAVLEPAAPVHVASPPSPHTRRTRLQFSTQVGSHEQVFSTQLSITHTPSAGSELSLASNFPIDPQPSSFHGEPPSAGLPTEPQPSGFTNESQSCSLSTDAPSENVFVVLQSVSSVPEEPSFANFDVESSLAPLRDTHITSVQPFSSNSPLDQAVKPFWSEEVERADAKDSSESSASSGRLGSAGGEDAEQRGLVVQESFEDELPYVPTTLPLERPVALPMVPVAERGGLRVARVERPRPSACAAPVPRLPAPLPATQPAPAGDKLHISLPRRPRPASAPFAAPAVALVMPAAAAPSWIDFEELPERRAPPKRIQTLPAAAAGEEPQYSYVEPEHCRCECHAHAEDDAH